VSGQVEAELVELAQAEAARLALALERWRKRGAGWVEREDMDLLIVDGARRLDEAEATVELVKLELRGYVNHLWSQDHPQRRGYASIGELVGRHAGTVREWVQGRRVPGQGRRKAS
jgi:hypothetical protein